MPIYTYECKKCGSTLRAMVGADENPTTCSEVTICAQDGEITKYYPKLTFVGQLKKTPRKPASSQKNTLKKTEKFFKKKKTT